MWSKKSLRVLWHSVTLNNIKCSRHFWSCSQNGKLISRIFYRLIGLALQKFRREGDVEEAVFIRCGSVRNSFAKRRKSTNFSSSVSVFLDIVKLVTRDSFTRNGDEGKICKAISIHQAHLSPIFWRASTPSHSPDVFSDSALNKSPLSPGEGMKSHLFPALRRNAHLYLHA